MNRLKVSYSKDFEIDDFQNKIWQNSDEIKLEKYWSGALAGNARHAEARSVWSEKGLFVWFQGNQSEPLVVNAKPERAEKRINLWERDVFEIFVAPDSSDPKKLF